MQPFNDHTKKSSISFRDSPQTSSKKVATTIEEKKVINKDHQKVKQGKEN